MALQKPTYHFNVVYNQAMSPLSRTPDTDLSLKFTEELTRRCDARGFKDSYYHDRDRVLGRYIFSEYTRVINSSKFTIIIITEGFMKDCFANYKQHTALKILLDTKRTDKLIPIVIGLQTAPDELRAFECEYFTDDVNLWRTPDRDSEVELSEVERSWKRVLNRLTRQEINLIDNQNMVLQERGDGVLRSERNQAIIAQATESSVLGDDNESCMSNRRLEQRVATVELNPLRQGSTQQASLTESPVIRPPNLAMAGTNQSDGIQLTNRSSAIRQQSLSLDGDLATDQPISDRSQATPDSGFNPGLSGYSSDISGRLSTTSDSLPVSTSNSLSEISEIALNQNGNMIDCDRLRNETLHYAQSSSINRVFPVVHSTNGLADADSGTTCNEGAMNGEGSMNNPEPFSQQYASATSSTCSETHVKSVYPVSGENDHIDDAQREEVTEVINLTTMGTQATKPEDMAADDRKMETTTEGNLHDSDMAEDVISEDNNVAGSESNVEPLQSKETKDRRKTLLPNLFANVMKCLAKPECAYNGMI